MVVLVTVGIAVPLPVLKVRVPVFPIIRTVITVHLPIGKAAVAVSLWVVVPRRITNSALPSALLGVSDIKFSLSPKWKIFWLAAPPLHNTAVWISISLN
jgi:hypothetical protein